MRGYGRPVWSDSYGHNDTIFGKPIIKMIIGK
jgi:hypothetical protein